MAESGDLGIAGFEYASVEVGPTTYRPGAAGSGAPVLLLHGFPQTHYCWHLLAPGLSARNTVVVCDLKGCGESRSARRPEGRGYSNRERAAKLVAVMARLGFGRFAVVGHDRGGRVAYRMALDHPEVVERLGVLNIVPTVDQFERMADAVSLDYFPWYLMAQPPRSGAARRRRREDFVRHLLAAWSATPGAISAQAAERYVRGFTPEAIAGICADFRAAFDVDRVMDAEDRAAGRRIRCPVLVHWGAEEGSMSDGPLPVWRAWAADVRGGPLPSGHFLPRRRPSRCSSRCAASSRTRPELLRRPRRGGDTMGPAMQLAGTAVLAVALLALTAACGGEGDDATSEAASAPAAARRATLMPLSGDPFKVRGTGFRARERVRVTVTATAAERHIVRRVRATGRGTFVLAFSGVEACGGVEGAATGSRGSRASFQFSSIRC